MKIQPGSQISYLLALPEHHMYIRSNRQEGFQLGE